MIENNLSLVLIIFIGIIVIYCLFQNNKEGFVKYYGQTALGQPDYLGNITGNLQSSNVNQVTKNFNLQVNAQQNIERSFQAVADKQATKRANLIGSIQPMKSYEGDIDVGELNYIVSSLIMPSVNEEAKKIQSDALYSFVNILDVDVTAWANGVRKIGMTLDIHDKSANIWTTYTNHLRVVFYYFNGEAILASVNFLEDKKGEEADAPIPYDKQLVNSEQIINREHLVYPWYTTEPSSGLYTTQAQRDAMYRRKAAKATEPNFFCIGVKGGVKEGDIKTREECTNRGGSVAAVIDKTMGNPEGFHQSVGKVARNDPYHLYTSFCYDCGANNTIKNLGPCCAKQQANLTEKNVLAQQFPYVDDLIDRRQFRANYKQRGLSWHRRMSRFEKDIPNKKQVLYELAH